MISRLYRTEGKISLCLNRDSSPEFIAFMRLTVLGSIYNISLFCYIPITIQLSHHYRKLPAVGCFSYTANDSIKFSDEHSISCTWSSERVAPANTMIQSCVPTQHDYYNSPDWSVQFGFLPWNIFSAAKSLALRSKD